MENGNEPIIPVKDLSEFNINGLTKREYFAGLAMQGLLSNPNTGQVKEGHRYIDHEKIIAICLNFSDELLKQLDHE